MLRQSTLTLAILSSLMSAPAWAEAPAETVDTLVQSLQLGDPAAIQEVFTDDAGYAYSLEGALNRGAAFDAWLMSDIIGPGSKFEIQSAEVSGDTVDTLSLWGRGDAINRPVRYVFTVVNGKIDSWRMSAP